MLWDMETEYKELSVAVQTLLHEVYLTIRQPLRKEANGV